MPARGRRAAAGKSALVSGAAVTARLPAIITGGVARVTVDRTGAALPAICARKRAGAPADPDRCRVSGNPASVRCRGEPGGTRRCANRHDGGPPPPLQPSTPSHASDPETPAPGNPCRCAAYNPGHLVSRAGLDGHVSTLPTVPAVPVIPPARAARAHDVAPSDPRRRAGGAHVGALWHRGLPGRVAAGVLSARQRVRAAGPR